MIFVMRAYTQKNNTETLSDVHAAKNGLRNWLIYSEIVEIERRPHIWQFQSITIDKAESMSYTMRCIHRSKVLPHAKTHANQAKFMENLSDNRHNAPYIVYTEWIHVHLRTKTTKSRHQVLFAKWLITNVFVEFIYEYIPFNVRIIIKSGLLRVTLDEAAAAFAIYDMNIERI